jgi:DNA-directed RNA polymerase specialized sigma24 family protein
VTTVAIGQRVPSSAQRRKPSAAMLLLPLQSLVLHHAGLDLDRRAVFVMHALDEIPVPEIASTLAIPLNTAYSRMRLARWRYLTEAIGDREALLAKKARVEW